MLPGVEVATAEEQDALRLAVRLALDTGVATEVDGEGQASNKAMVSIGRKLGVRIPEWCDQ